MKKKVLLPLLSFFNAFPRNVSLTNRAAAKKKTNKLKLPLPRKNLPLRKDDSAAKSKY